MSQAQDDVLQEKNVLIRIRDGTELAAEIQRPGTAGQVPAILTMDPYRKDDLAGSSDFAHYFVNRGYAVMRVDLRGTGNSGAELRSKALLSSSIYVINSACDRS